MHRFAKLLAGATLLGLSAAAFATSPPVPVPTPGTATQAPEVEIVTTAGNIFVRLDPARAPITVKNFLEYVKSGFYDGTIFHRVVPDFVIQGGGFTATYQLKKTRPPIPNESGNGLENLRGTIAMARKRAPNSATSQFYINLANNTRLDPQPNRRGYAVFGKVVGGMNVVDKIASVPTGSAGPFARNAPLTPVVIQKVVVVKSPAGKTGAEQSRSK